MRPLLVGLSFIVAKNASTLPPMSEPAHYVLLESRGVSHFFSNWGGISTNFDLFWGPEHALAFVRKQEPVSGWDDEDDIEGGALLDPRNRTMLLFGGEGMGNPLKQRATLALMRRVWGPEWKLVWAREGIVSFADYLGVSRDAVRTWYPPSAPDLEELLGGHPEFTLGVISMRRPDGLVTLHPTECFADDLFDGPPSLLERLIASSGRTKLTLPLGGEDMTIGGVHLDVAARKADVWSVAGGETPAAWDGWQVTHHLDHFEVQENATEGALRFIPLPQHEVVNELAAMYRQPLDEGPDPHAMLEAMNPNRREGTVDPRFFTHTPHLVPHEERVRLLDRALVDFPQLWREDAAR
jgi:hypothetical protein